MSLDVSPLVLDRAGMPSCSYKDIPLYIHGVFSVHYMNGLMHNSIANVYVFSLCS